MALDYVPILLTKQGELSGLGDLDAEAKRKFSPLFAVHPIQYDYERDTKKTADQHVAGLGRRIAVAWGDAGRAFIDPLFIQGEPVQPGAPDPAGTILNEAAADGLLLTPVVTPGQSPEYTALAAAWHHAHGTGLCARLASGQWPTSPARTQHLSDLLSAMSVTPADVDLVLDVGAGITDALVLETVTMALRALPHAHEWRSVVLAGGACPGTVSEIRKHQLVRLPRCEWIVYNRIRAEAGDAGTRVPVFGDYGVAHPDPAVSEINPALMSISSKQFYTVDGAWLVAKGDLYKGRGGLGVGGPASYPLARMIVDSGEFLGPDYSPGSGWMATTARGEGGGGNSLTWRRAWTSHHLTFVSESLATQT